MLRLLGPSPLLRTLAIAVVGLTLPLLWPGLLKHFFDLGSVMAGRPGAPRPLTVLQIGSDTLIGAAYTVIAGLIAHVVYRNRTRLPFSWVILSFGLFIIAWGLTHVMHVLIHSLPLVWLDGYLRAITALVSLATAAALPPLLPRISALIDADERSAHQQAQLEQTNQRLEQALHDTEILYALSSSLERTRSVEDVLREVSALLARVTQVDSFLLWSVQGDHAQVIHAQGGIDVSAAAFFTQGIDRPRGSLWAVIDHQTPRYIGEAASFSGVLHERLKLGVHTLAHLPLPTKEATYALTCLRRTAAPWTGRTRRLLEAAAQSVSVALERQHHAALLEAAARTDPLTGLGNRRAFDEALDAAVSASQRQQRPALSVLSLDLDGLKTVNDRGGHAQGDQYLKGFARALRAALRREDSLFRVGGDEFMAILPNTGPQGFQGVLRRVREAVEELRRDGFGQANVSAGMAAYPVETETLAELVRLSDERLYQDKRHHHRQLTEATSPSF